MPHQTPPPWYKPSPFRSIPSDWEVLKLQDVCSHFKSGFGITSGRIFHSGEFPVYGGNGLRGFTDSYTHEGEYLLIGRQGALCGNIQKVSKKSYISEHAIAVQTNTKNDLQYLAYKLEARNLNRLSESSAQPGLSVEKLLRLKMEFPPLPEQTAIANLLSKWDEAIEQISKLVEKHEKRKKWLSQQLFWSKNTRVNAWDLFESVSIKWSSNEVLLSATQDKGIIPRSMLEWRVTMPSTGETETYKLVSIGNFVISLRSFQGWLEYSEYRWVVSPAYTVLKPRKDICNDYYKYYFKSYDFIWHLSIAVVGIRDGKQISYEDFCTVKIPFPVYKEQHRVASILLMADQEITSLKQKLTKLKEQKKGLMQILLTGKKRLIF